MPPRWRCVHCQTYVRLSGTVERKNHACEMWQEILSTDAPEELCDPVPLFFCWRGSTFNLGHAFIIDGLQAHANAISGSSTKIHVCVADYFIIIMCVYIPYTYYIYIYICIHTHMYIHIISFKYMCIHIYIHIHPHVTFMYICIYIYKFKCKYIHIYM